MGVGLGGVGVEGGRGRWRGGAGPGAEGAGPGAEGGRGQLLDTSTASWRKARAEGHARKAQQRGRPRGWAQGAWA